MDPEIYASTLTEERDGDEPPEAAEHVLFVTLEVPKCNALIRSSKASSGIDDAIPKRSKAVDRANNCNV